MNYANARDWEVIENARRGYDAAIAEAKRRGLDYSPRPERGVFWTKARI